MQKLTEHFALEEFTNSTTALALGIENTPTATHMKNLQKLAEGMEEVRALFNKVIEITSGYRNPQINKAVGGVKNSAHALGWAAEEGIFTDGDRIIFCSVGAGLTFASGLLVW